MTDSHSLPAKLYLLAFDPDRGKLTKRDVLGHVLRAAVLVELTERGCLTDDGGRARTVGDRRTGEPMLDDALRWIAGQDRPRKWKTLVQRQRRETFQAVQQQLVRDGVVSVEHRTWLPDRVAVRYAGLIKALRAEAAATLDGGPAQEYTPCQAALVALSAAGKLPSVPGADRRRQRKRIKELTERSGEAGIALRKALAERQAAVAGSAASAGAAGS